MPFSLYLSLVYWVYPLKNIIGETGCYVMIYLRNMGTFTIQLQSFFMATFRYICLFHEDFLLKRFSPTPTVSGHFFFHLHDYECKQFFDFQVLARFMVGLNLLLPIFSFSFILIDKSPSLNICLGKGYLNFFSTKAQFCPEDNPYKNCLCWVWLTILSIGKSKFQINSLARISNLINSIT